MHIRFSSVAGQHRSFTLPLVGRVDEQFSRSEYCEAGWGYNLNHIVKWTPTPVLRTDPPHKGEGKTL